ncbi:MAG: four helix bundle protein [Chloroflexi bacterium]|nr:four helix bundle protein [Chloroflexota bacterium]
MSNLAHAKSFRDLVVYQKARELSKEIFQLSKSFPKDENFSLTGQIRRSSRAIGANIAEAWAKRKYEKHFVSKLTDADGEQQETQHWIGTALDCGYITAQTEKTIDEHCAEIGRMLGGMMEKAELFCGDTLRLTHEAKAEYLIASDTDD